MKVVNCVLRFLVRLSFDGKHDFVDLTEILGGK